MMAPGLGICLGDEFALGRLSRGVGICSVFLEDMFTCVGNCEEFSQVEIKRC